MVLASIIVKYTSTMTRSGEHSQARVWLLVIVAGRMSREEKSAPYHNALKRFF